MKIYFYSTILAISSLTLTGCMTSHVWQTSPVNKKTHTYHPLQQDQLISFGKIVHPDQSKNQFLVVGEQHLYALTKGNEKIQDFLSLKSSESELEIVIPTDDTLRLTIKKDHENHNEIYFTANLTLKLKVKSPSQETALDITNKSLELSASMSRSEQGLDFILTTPIEGKIYTAQKDLVPNQKQPFSKKYKIEIGYDQQKNNFNAGNLIGNIIQSPIALAADAVIIAFIPIAFVSYALDPKTKK